MCIDTTLERHIYALEISYFISIDTPVPHSL